MRTIRNELKVIVRIYLLMLGIFILASLLILAIVTGFKPIESNDVGRLSYWQLVIFANLFSPVYALIGTIATYVFSYINEKILNKWVVIIIASCFVVVYLILFNLKSSWILRIIVINGRSQTLMQIV